MPLEKACANTTTSGSTTKTVRNKIARVMMAMRTAFGSVRRLSRAAAACARAFASGEESGTESAICIVIASPSMHRDPVLRPALQPVHREDDDEGHDKHDDRDGRRVGIAEFGQPDHNQQWRNLGDVRQIARDEDDRA